MGKFQQSVKNLCFCLEVVSEAMRVVPPGGEALARYDNIEVELNDNHKLTQTQDCDSNKTQMTQFVG